MKPYYSDSQITLHHGDSLAVLREMPDASVDCCGTDAGYFHHRRITKDKPCPACLASPQRRRACPLRTPQEEGRMTCTTCHHKRSSHRYILTGACLAAGCGCGAFGEVRDG